MVGFGFHFLLMAVFSALLLSMPRIVCGLFTFQEEILTQFKTDILVITFLFVCDATMSTMAGVIKGVSMQSVSSVSNIISYCLISIPGMYLFCFQYNMGLFGIFLGYDIGSLTNLLFNFYLIIYKEWKMYDFKDLLESEEEDEESLYYNLEGESKKILDPSTSTDSNNNIQ